jgi:purine-binding chemotaxis protein CheW
MTDAAPAPAPEAALHVVFRVGDADYVIAADSVLQIESFTGATPVPGSASFLAGIVQIRGKVIPLVDMRARFGAPAAEAAVEGRRIIVGQHGERVVGLLVDSAREVLKIAPGDLKRPPQILDAQARGFVRAVAQLGARLVMLIDFAKVIGEEQLDVGAD